MFRSGIEILSSHPKLYWNNDAFPGSEWLRLGDEKRTPTTSDLDTEERYSEEITTDGSGFWTASDEETDYSPWIALPGGSHIGLGRHWHFWAVTGWILTGILYIGAMVFTWEWRLIPTSWSIFPRASNAFLTYLSFQIPEATGYNALQKLSYFGIIYIVTPIQILTGIAMAPAIRGRFPRFQTIFGGRQGARTIHFFGLLIFIGFLIVHVSMVVIHGLPKELAIIILGSENASHTLALILGFVGIGGVIAFHVVGTWMSHRWPNRTKDVLEIGVEQLRGLIFNHLPARKTYGRISTFARPNGRPPRNDEYQRHQSEDFENWELDVTGLVETPMTLSMHDLRDFPKKTQTTRHDCIQGWTYHAQWGGVPVSAIINRCEPHEDAQYMVAKTKDEKWEYTEDGPSEPVDNGRYYETITMGKARESQTILAYEMNAHPLPVAHGAPLRLRVESVLGFKMAKWVDEIEFVEDYDDIGQGKGGWRNDVQQYYMKSGI